jgi:hypothetical protein
MLVVVSIPITGNTTKKHDITGWFAWDCKGKILPKIFGQTMFVSEQFQNAVIYAYFYKISLKIALEKQRRGRDSNPNLLVKAGYQHYFSNNKLGGF